MPSGAPVPLCGRAPGALRSLRCVRLQVTPWLCATCHTGLRNGSSGVQEGPVSHCLIVRQLMTARFITSQVIA
jgi:hypothetical protein